ncbi:hypothetical protein ABPG74_016435 [Tetrahymena malaccensis]
MKNLSLKSYSLKLFLIYLFLFQQCVLCLDNSQCSNYEDPNKCMNTQIKRDGKFYYGRIEKSKQTDLAVPLLSDEYQFTMAYSHFENNKHNDKAVFELFFRVNPFQGEYTVFAGVEEVISFLKYFKITDEHIEYMRKIMPPHTKEEFFDWLKTLDCKQVKLSTMNEGSLVFPKEPLIQIEGPLSLLLILESPLIALTSFPTLVATNAARMRKVAGSKTLLEFGLRRAQSPGAALVASRYAYMGGFNETSNLLASSRYDIPVSSTMSHSYVTSYTSLDEVQDFLLNGVNVKQKALYYRQVLQFSKTSDSELSSFIAFSKSFPHKFLCLVDSFDSLKSGVPNFLAVALALIDAGYQPIGVRLDSGELDLLSIQARQIIDNAGLKVQKDLSFIKIMASDSINESKIKQYNMRGNAIDIFAIGTEIVTCKSQPNMGIVYKLVEVNELAKLKFSEDIAKSTLPGRKAVYRVWVESQSAPVADIIALPDEKIEGQSKIRVVSLQKTQERYTIIPKKIQRILHLVWENGEIVNPVFDLEESKQYLEQQMQTFDEQIIHDQKINKRYLIVTTEKYWSYFQKSAENVLIPKIIA